MKKEKKKSHRASLFKPFPCLLLNRKKKSKKEGTKLLNSRTWLDSDQHLLHKIHVCLFLFLISGIPDEPRLNEQKKTSQRVRSGQVRSSHRRFVFSGVSRLGWVGLGWLFTCQVHKPLKVYSRNYCIARGRRLQMHMYLRYCLHIVDTVQYSTVHR